MAKEKIEMGKPYATRGGLKAVVTSTTDMTKALYTVLAEVSYSDGITEVCSYTAGGHYHKHGRPGIMDLIEVLPKISKGKVYKTRDGCMVTILRDDLKAPIYKVAALITTMGFEAVYSYTDTGRANNDYESDDDLVEVVTD